MGTASKLIQSAFLSTGAKFTSRVIGLVSTLIVARILTPSDFAAIALISLCLYFFDTLSHAGSEQYLIQKTQLKSDDINTAWTLDLILKSTLAIFLILISPLLARFLESPHITQGLQVASLVLVINAIRHPELILKKRALNYQAYFILSLIQKISAFTVVISLAIYLQSFWAFVIADIVSASVLTLGSFYIRQHRLQFSLIKLKKQWDFSKWMLSKSLLGYLRAQIDTILVAKFFIADKLGHYYMARDTAMLPATSILGPAIEPLLAAFKDEKNNLVSLTKKFNLVLFISIFLIAPVISYLMIFPKLTINALLGEQWVLAGSLLRPLALLFLYWVILLIIENALIALGKVKLIFYADLLTLVITFVLLLSFLLNGIELNTLAWVRGLIGIVSTFVLAFWLNYVIKFDWLNLITAVIFASISAAISSLIAYQVIKLNTFSVLTSFLLSGSIHVICYVLFTALICHKLKKNNYFLYCWQLMTQSIKVLLNKYLVFVQRQKK